MLTLTHTHTHTFINMYIASVQVLEPMAQAVQRPVGSPLWTSSAAAWTWICPALCPCYSRSWT